MAEGKSTEKIQCPCGRIINSPEEYKIVYLKHELQEIDILRVVAVWCSLRLLMPRTIFIKPFGWQQ